MTARSSRRTLKNFLSDLVSRSRTTVSSLAAATLLLGAAQAQMAPGDLLVNVNDFTARLLCLRPDGTLRWTATGGTGSDWIGCAVTVQGRVVVTRSSPTRGVNVFDRNGVQIADFQTPQILSARDISVFSDGTLAICDVTKIELYTESGVSLGAMFPTSANRPFGGHVDRNDILFICDQGSGPIPSRIFKLDRAGQTLATITLDFLPGDLVAAADGTLWVTCANPASLYHLSASGVEIANYYVPFNGPFEGITTASDGSLFFSGAHSKIYHWSGSPSEAYDSFLVPGLNNYSIKKFITTVPCGSTPTSYCTAKVNSVGCTPAIGASGQASASSNSGFVVRATNMRNQKAGLLLYSLAGRNAQPFQGGTLCVQPPVRRTTGVGSGGSALPVSDCSGIYALDMNAFAQGLLGGSPLLALRTPGTLVNCQWWGRDPGFAAPNATTLSDGLEYVICE